MEELQLKYFYQVKVGTWYSLDRNSWYRKEDISAVDPNRLVYSFEDVNFIPDPEQIEQEFEEVIDNSWVGEEEWEEFIMNDLPEFPPLEAGSWKAIGYELCHVIDEILHGVGLDSTEWGFRFCQWSHRYDGDERRWLC